MGRRSIPFLLCILLSFSAGIRAQNLVPNGDFETHNACPTNLSELDYATTYTSFTYAANWMNPMQNTSSDYFNSCAIGPNAQVPVNLVGYHTPRSGNAYAGLFSKWGPGPLAAYSEYIENRLSIPLIAGHSYYVRYYVSRASTHFYESTTWIVGMDRLGVLFSNTFISSPFPTRILTNTPSVMQPGNFITDTLNWTKISGVYTAAGGEQFILIGNFMDGTVHNPAIVLHSPAAGFSDSLEYTYIDDVCIRDLGHPDFTTSKDTQICNATQAVILPLPTIPEGKYIWNTGDTSASAPVHGTGKYWRTTLGDCLAYVDTINVSLSNIIPHVAVTNPSCFQDSNGIIALSPTGGAAPYKYANGTGGFSTTPVFNNLGPGTYTIHIVDANSCGKDTTVTLVQPTQLVVSSLVKTDLRCYNDNSGVVIVKVSGGTTPYVYAFNASGYQSSDTLTGLPAGASLIHIVDKNGCKADVSATLAQPPALVLHIDSSKDPICEGDKNGFLQLSASGGNGAYQYSLPDSSHYTTKNVYTNLTGGTYVVYIRDSKHCVADTTLVLNPPFVILSNIVITDASCFNGTNGSINLLATASSAVAYQLDNGAARATGFFDSLRAKQYTVTISYSANCHKDTSLTVTQPAVITANVTTTPVDCEGMKDNGTAIVTPDGGTPPYTYLWLTDVHQTDAAISGITSGDYKVVVRDANNCSDSVMAAVMYNDCCHTYLPNAFSPNGDNKNDIFRIKFDGNLKLERFSIYNRFGQAVFNTTDAQKGWDGMFHGIPQDLDVYYYYIKAICGNGGDHEISLKGDVLLVR